MSCVFCSIIEKETDAHIVYENEHTIAFLDAHPKVRWHTLLISKKHYKNMFDIPEHDFAQLSASLHHVSRLVTSKLGAQWCNILHASWKEAQQSVFHFHFHILPRFKNDEINAWPDIETKKLDLEDISKNIRKTIT